MNSVNIGIRRAIAAMVRWIATAPTCRLSDVDVFVAVAQIGSMSYLQCAIGHGAS
jgi:hypothetical protein